MKTSKALEGFAYCAFPVLLSSILIGLVLAVWMAIYAGVTQ
ncbi:hypothetical protein [Pseudomonas sp. CCI1.1]|nr:hypothetical protein [Pseudomonas sp. CCI1.1]MEB0189981.1 hypothetical protein [Pseudomonas sp. CCI1.1]WPX48392.1 hypothetical protein RHM69_29510 [Pseudomonas sp. CCI1.1]